MRPRSAVGLSFVQRVKTSQTVNLLIFGLCPRACCENVRSKNESCKSNLEEISHHDAPGFSRGVLLQEFKTARSSEVKNA